MEGDNRGGEYAWLEPSGGGVGWGEAFPRWDDLLPECGSGIGWWPSIGVPQIKSQSDPAVSELCRARYP